MPTWSFDFELCANSFQGGIFYVFFVLIVSRLDTTKEAYNMHF